MTITNAISSPSEIQIAKTTSSALQWYSKFMVLAVLLLIFMGALVTSHQAGLSVPDWPTTYGHNMFTYPYEKWTGGIFFEHSHRLVASGIGFLTIILCVWVWRAKRQSSIRWLGVAALGVVILQGCLGGLTVLLQLPPAVSVCHGVLGQSFLVLLVVLAYLLSKEFHDKTGSAVDQKTAKKLYTEIFSLTILIYLQLLVGAIMRHTFSGIAVPDFPTMGGEWLPSFDSNFLSVVNQMRADVHLAPIGYFNVVIHLLHRAAALLIFLAVISLAFKILVADGKYSQKLKAATWYVLLFTMIQVTLGITALLTVREPFSTSFHVVTGAALLALAVLMTLRAYMQRSKAVA